MRHVDDMIDSEYVSICVHIVRMIVLLLVINHLIGCAWFAIASTANGDTWVLIHGFSDDNWSYQYATAFHWSITQFTPASMHVQPQNMSERTFAIAVVVFALVVFSYLVGSITGSLTQLRSMQEDTSKQFWNVRRYMKKNRVSVSLAGRIQRYLEFAWQNRKQNQQLGNIKIFSLLSDQLRSELECELSVSHLSIHPLFAHLHSLSTVTVHRLASLAIQRKMLACEDPLFIQGEQASQMYIVVEGKLRYLRRDTKGKLHEEMVDQGEDWISEPVLWMKEWTHLGWLTAITECDLLLVRAKEFGEVVRRNPAAFHLASAYARNYVAWIRSQQPEDLTDITQGEDVGPRVSRFMGLGQESGGLRTPTAWG